MAVDGTYDQLQLQEIDDATYGDLTNVPYIPNGSVLVPVQLQSGGTGFVLVQTQSGGTGSVPVQMQSGGKGSVLGTSPDTRLLEFKRTFPQALGTVQIMVGALLFLFGVVSCFFGGTITVFTGAFVWAPLFYIIAGSLTVAADRSMSRCMIKGSMGMNIVAAVVSGVAIILYGLDVAWVISQAAYYRYGHDREVPGLFTPIIYRGLSMGVPGVLVQCVFNLLVFIVSICVSIFGCKATCC